MAAIRFLVELVLKTPDWIMRLDGEAKKEVMRRTEQRFQQVNESLMQMAEDDPTLWGMGTTLTLACSLGRDLIIGHAGDSRAYLYRDGRLLRLTRDHTMVQALIDLGVVRRSDAEKHPLRHVLLNVIGTEGRPVRADIDQLTLADGDQVLLCTDGLTDMIQDMTIAEVLGQPRPAGEACQALVERALEAGGKDNVTVVLGRYCFR
jgi:protein phosphatase